MLMCTTNCEVILLHEWSRVHFIDHLRRMNMGARRLIFSRIQSCSWSRKRYLIFSRIKYSLWSEKYLKQQDRMENVEIIDKIKCSYGCGLLSFSCIKRYFSYHTAGSVIRKRDTNICFKLIGLSRITSEKNIWSHTGMCKRFYQHFAECLIWQNESFDPWP